jgi:RNA polymerase sigma factor (sigma-70 family)
MSDFVTQIENNRRIIYHIIYKYCSDESYADDLFQDILCRAWPSYPSFRGESSFKQWIARIARNTAIDRLRRIKLNTVLTANCFYEIIDEPYTEKQLPTMGSLSHIERTTLDMVLNGLSYAEISNKMNEPENRIRVRMHRIKQRLSKQINHTYGH